jgi:hypothetical protein
MRGPVNRGSVAAGAPLEEFVITVRLIGRPEAGFAAAFEFLQGAAELALSVLQHLVGSAIKRASVGSIFLNGKEHEIEVTLEVSWVTDLLTGGESS